MSKGSHPRSSELRPEATRFLNPSPPERKWVCTIPDSYPDIMRAPAVVYKSGRDNQRIQTNKYVAFARPYRGRQGLLIIGKEQRPIIINEAQPDQPKILPMRLDREVILGTWVFAISIYEAEGLIQLEDCVVADGEQLRSTRNYKDRYSLLERFGDIILFQDQRFQCNWKVQITEVFSLANVKQAITGIHGGCLCLMPNLPSLRLLKILPQVQEVKEIVGGPTEFICVGVEGKPDIYDLKKSDGTNLGRASIQTLNISQALQQKRATGQEMRVMAEWDEDFESYVVTTVL